MEIDKDLLSEIGQLLLEMSETVSVAESVTSGFLQFSFSQMTDASKFFKGGITAYTLEEKVKFLKVDKNEAEKCDCVSENIAETMSLNAAESFNTNWGIAVTGYATPAEESDYKIFAYFSLSYKNEIIFTKKLDLHSRTEPQNAQVYYSEFILGCFRTHLQQHQSRII